MVSVFTVSVVVQKVKDRFSERRAKLVWAMPSVEVFEAKPQRAPPSRCFQLSTMQRYGQKKGCTCYVAATRSRYTPDFRVVITGKCLPEFLLQGIQEFRCLFLTNAPQVILTHIPSVPYMLKGLPSLNSQHLAHSGGQQSSVRA